MDEHVGRLYHAARLVVGALLVVAAGAGLGGAFRPGPAGPLVGAILLVTVTGERCPVDLAAGIDTAERRPHRRFRDRYAGFIPPSR